jgi:hypothetical protein
MKPGCQLPAPIASRGDCAISNVAALKGVRARTHRRGGVLVAAVGGADLDVGEPAAVRASVLLLGEGAGDAGPSLHLGIGGIVHGGVGDDVGDGEPRTA